MLKLEFSSGNGPTKILCLGAHCDDIEIGCGGSILQWARNGSHSDVKWVVFTSDVKRGEEARRSAEGFLKDMAQKDIVIRDFPDSFLSYKGQDVKVFFEEIKEGFDPDIILTHFGKDAHQDHRLINELTWNTFRNHLILEYEIPKYDGDLGSPNFFIPIDADLAEEKIRLIIENFQSQSEKHWFDREIFLSILRIRGMESASGSRYSEAFYVRKAVMQD